MAPEFFPFILCAALVLASLAACVVSLTAVTLALVRRRGWPAAALSVAATCALIAAAGTSALYIRGAFWLDEPMAIAACQGDLQEVGRLLDRGASPNGCTVDCAYPALVCAADGGHTEVVRLLLKKGADPSAPDHGGRTALDVARAGGRAEMLRLLTEASER